MYTVTTAGTVIFGGQTPPKISQLPPKLSYLPVASHYSRYRLFSAAKQPAAENKKCRK
jgi:hypothetical protein